ncbi:MAG: hypothetical protein ABIR62_15650 [Dokdonella sp.]
MLAIWTPLVAVLVSPAFPRFVESLRDHTATPDVAKNRLRAATPLWNDAVAAYNSLAYRMGVSPQPASAVVGRWGWLFLGDRFDRNLAQAVGRDALDATQATQWVETASLQRRWLAARGIASMIIIAPAKWSIYPDMLPAWTTAVTKTHSFDRLLEYRATLPLLDLRPTLREARHHADTYSPFNSHWNDYGAYIGWLAITRHLNERVHGLEKLAAPLLSGVAERDDGNEFAAMLSIERPNPWTTVQLQAPLADVDILDDSGHARKVVGNTSTDLLDLPRTTHTAVARSPMRALVLRDSSGNSLSPYLQDAFADTLQVDQHWAEPNRRPNLPALVQQYKPDVVFWIMTERYLGQPFGDLSYWRSATAFDCARADAGSTESVLVAAPSASGAAGRAHPAKQVALVVIDSSLESIAHLRWNDDKGEGDRLIAVVPGRNDVFVEISGHVVDGSVSVTGSGAKLVEVRSRSSLDTSSSDECNR